MAQQDDYFYEIQLTNKQLVFYFLAGATGLVLSFLAGVMVGRGVDQQGGDVQAARPVQEERVVAEETPRPAPSAQDLTYAQRLESERAEDRLERVKPSPAAPAATVPPATRPPATAPPATQPPATQPPATQPPATQPAATARRTADGGPTAARPADPRVGAPAPAARPTVAPPPTTAARAAVPASGGSFSIQVGAFKDRGSADAIVSRLKGKGFSAFVVTPQEGLFNVRVGSYGTREDAEKVQDRLRAEKFNPFIVRN